MDHPYSFGKNQKLCSQRAIDRLFADGHRLMSFPYAVTWMTFPMADQPVPAQVLIVAPKHHLRHAVDRNLTKRKMRELYRLNRQPLMELLEQHQLHLQLAIRYVSHDLFDYAFLEKKYLKMQRSLMADIQKYSQPDEVNQ